MTCTVVPQKLKRMIWSEMCMIVEYQRLSPWQLHCLMNVHLKIFPDWNPVKIKIQTQLHFSKSSPTTATFHIYTQKEAHSIKYAHHENVALHKFIQNLGTLIKSQVSRERK